MATNPSGLTDATLGAILGALSSLITVLGAMTICTILLALLLMKRKGMRLIKIV